jgi:hypothetical protein
MTATTGQNADFTRAYELLKRVYAARVEDMVPESDRLSKDIPFVTGDKQPGQIFYQPVTLTREGGATFWNDGSIKTLNQPLAALELSASIQGAEIAVRSALSYKFLNTALKQLNGTQAGARAFVNATKDRFEKLSKGASYFRECTTLYGSGPAAVASAVAPGQGLGRVLTTTGTSGTSLVVQLEPATWATAIWAGSRDLEFDIYSTAGVQRNTAGTGATTIYKLVSDNPALYQLTFTSEASTNVADVVATDEIFFAGARGADALGFMGACILPGTDLWGINPVTYSLWKPQLVPVGGSLNFEKLQDGATAVAALGFSGSYDVYVNPATFQDLCNDQAALISHANGKTEGSLSIGFDDLKFKSQAGTMYIKAHPYMKRGFALGIPRDYCMRIGSTDLTHTMPGFGKMFREMENAAGVEMRLYSDQAPFCKHASYMVAYTGIVNTSD